MAIWAMEGLWKTKFSARRFPFSAEYAKINLNYSPLFGQISVAYG